MNRMTAGLSGICTADIYDKFQDELTVCTLQFRSFGLRLGFAGLAETLRTHEDHTPVLQLLSESGDGRVLVVDGGGSLRVGVMGDKLAEIAVRNRWIGVVIFGAVRDSYGIDRLEIGVKALGTTARRSWVPSQGERGVRLAFGDIVVEPGNWVVADSDAVMVSRIRLDIESASVTPPSR